MRQAIINRVSRRTFTEEPLTEAEKSKILKMIEELNAESGLTVTFVDDGREAFEKRGKSYGMFKNVRPLILMKGPASDPNLKEKTGYYGEDLILDLTDMDLGTCWVAGTFNRSLIQVPDGEEMTCVIPLGHIKKITIKERILRAAISKKRIPVEKRLEGFDQAPEKIQQAMVAVQFAPSAVNTQHPVFCWKDGQLTARVDEKGPTDLVDLGIAKKNFEEGYGGGKFELGNGGAFRIQN